MGTRNTADQPRISRLSDRHSALITVQFGAFTFSREYALS